MDQTSKNQVIQKNESIISEDYFSDFLNDDDISQMSENNINDIFKFCTKNMLKEAVYPHLNSCSNFNDN